MEIKLDRDEIAKAILDYVQREITRTPMGKVAVILEMYDLPYDGIRILYNDVEPEQKACDVETLKESPEKPTPEEEKF